MLNILTAFPAEARPVIDCLGLEPAGTDGEFSCYAGAGARLAVCGPGAARAGRAVRFLCGQPGGEHARWLNFGVAGSGSHPVGALVLVRSVRYRRHRVATLPARPALGLPQAALCTVDAPQPAYRDKELVDMEAAGMLIALKEGDGQADCTIVKLVSDNPGRPLDTVSQADLKALLRDSRQAICGIIRTLHAAAGEPL